MPNRFGNVRFRPLAHIAEAAVVGRSNARWGEVPVWVAVRKGGTTITEADVLALVDGALARYKHPREVVFLDALPRNAMVRFSITRSARW